MFQKKGPNFIRFLGFQRITEKVLISLKNNLLIFSLRTISKQK